MRHNSTKKGIAFLFIKCQHTNEIKEAFGVLKHVCLCMHTYISFPQYICCVFPSATLHTMSFCSNYTQLKFVYMITYILFSSNGKEIGVI